MPALLSSSATSVVAYDDVHALPENAIIALNEKSKESNVILASVEKALARTQPPKRKEYWIVCTTDDVVEYVLSCTEGMIGSYPAFIFSRSPSSQLDDEVLYHRMSLITKKLCDVVGVTRVFSVFAPKKVTRAFEHLWSQLTGVEAVTTPYYAATFTYCDKASFVERQSTLHPSLRYDTRAAVESDIPSIADQCFGFAATSEPFVLSPEGALKEATLLVKNKQVWVHEIQKDQEVPELASIVCFTRQSANVVAITKVYTNPKWRKLGCAERLVRRVTKFLLKTKESVVLYVAHDNKAASNVYHRVGFVGLTQPEGAVDGVEPWLEIGFDTSVVELGHW